MIGSSANRWTQTAVAALVLLKLQWDFRVRGRRAVGRLTNAAMRVSPATAAELDERAVDPFMAASAVWRAKRRLPFKSTCLQTALATQKLLSYQGVHAAVRVGVRDMTGPAHAWVEVAGVTIDDQGLSGRFEPFADPGERARA